MICHAKIQIYLGHAKMPAKWDERDARLGGRRCVERQERERFYVRAEVAWLRLMESGEII